MKKNLHQGGAIKKKTKKRTKKEAYGIDNLIILLLATVEEIPRQMVERPK